MPAGRFRRSRRWNRRAGSGRRPVNWIVGSQTWDSQAALVAGGVQQGVISLELTGIAPGVTGNDPPTISRFLINTVKGRILFYGDNFNREDRAVISLGIGAVTCSNATPTPVFDPSNINDGDFGWMWLHHFPLQSNAGGNALSSVPQDTNCIAFVSTRTKRIMRDNMKLMLYAKCTRLQGAAVNVFMLPYLRTLVSGVS